MLVVLVVLFASMFPLNFSPHVQDLRAGTYGQLSGKQGEVLVFTLPISGEPDRVIGHLLKREIIFFQIGDKQYAGLLGLDMQDQPGLHELEIQVQYADRTKKHKVTVLLMKEDFRVQHLKLPKKMVDLDKKTLAEKEATIFGKDFLLDRPLLQAITHHQSPVLLIDELDRADEEFESFLLEILSEWQISVPEIGTIRASEPPYVILTSNRTRELSDAVRRRCFYLWLEYPEFEKELKIVRGKVPDIDERLAEQICRFMELVRQQKLEKVPGVAETLDWARALAALHQDYLDPEIINATLGIVFKNKSDVQQVKESLSEFTERLGIPCKRTPSDQENPVSFSTA